MPIRNIQFANDEFYHVIKRGVEGRNIFMDDEDRQRFMNSLLVFNDERPAPWFTRNFWSQRDPASLKDYKPEDPLVEIHAFALMNNHFHLLVRQIKNNGISNFMNKLGGYSYYFNKKYKRTGPLFQGRFRAVLVKTSTQLKNVFVYINTNPVGLVFRNWKENGIKDFRLAKDFLESYVWSSYQEYVGIIPPKTLNVLKTNFFIEAFGQDGCRSEVEIWLKYKQDMNEYKNLFLE